LVGRGEELALVDRAFRAPDTSGVVLVGAAGVGKTRLAREVLTAVEAQGWVTRWAVATEAAASIPFGALAHLLPAVSEASQNRSQLYRRAAADLVQEAGGGPLVLGVDDAHLLDTTSAALVHQCALQANGFVVGRSAPGVRHRLIRWSRCERTDWPNVRASSRPTGQP
jgi:AAA ATPase domain